MSLAVSCPFWLVTQLAPPLQSAVYTITVGLTMPTKVGIGRLTQGRWWIYVVKVNDQLCHAQGGGGRPEEEGTRAAKQDDKKTKTKKNKGQLTERGLLWKWLWKCRLGSPSQQMP